MGCILGRLAPSRRRPLERFRSLLGIWVTYIMFTVFTWGETSSVPLCSVAGAPRHRPCFAIPFPCSRHLTCRPVLKPNSLCWCDWLVFGGAVYLAWAIEYAVQTGRARIVSLKWLLPLTGFRASESSINCRILSIVVVNAALLLVAT